MLPVFGMPNAMVAILLVMDESDKYSSPTSIVPGVLAPQRITTEVPAEKLPPQGK